LNKRVIGFPNNREISSHWCFRSEWNVVIWIWSESTFLAFLSFPRTYTQCRAAKTRKDENACRLAFKSLEMHLPFDDCAIDSRSEKLLRSQKEKVDRLNRDWTGNPLSAYSIDWTGSAYVLKNGGSRRLVGGVHYPPPCDGDDPMQENLIKYFKEVVWAV
jgi:hypothetical protein